MGDKKAGQVTSRYIYCGKVVTLRLDTVARPDGSSLVREVVEHSGAVAIVPRLDMSTLILVKQYRQAVGEHLLEIPAGTLEPGESPLACADRELQEEIGFRAQRLIPMFSQYLAPGYSSEVLHVFLGDSLVSSYRDKDEDEEIELVRVPVADVEAMIMDGRIRDAKSIAGLLVALRIMH